MQLWKYRRRPGSRFHKKKTINGQFQICFLNFWIIYQWITHKKQGKSEGFDSCNQPSNLTQMGFNGRFFNPCDLEICWMTLKNYRAPLLHHIKLCASFQSHQWIKTGVTVRKRSIRIKSGDFLSSVTLKFHRWTWKTTGHLFCVVALFHSHQWIQTKVTVRTA